MDSYLQVEHIIFIHYYQTLNPQMKLINFVKLKAQDYFLWHKNNLE